jgi:hypothetical protein
VPTDVAADTGALGVLTVVGGLVGRAVEGEELVGGDVDVGGRELGGCWDVGADDACVELGLGELVGWDVVFALRDVGALEVGLVGVGDEAG